MKHEHISGPLGNFIASKSRGSFPIPLKSAGYEIEVRSGLAEVRMIRTFRNDEDRPIEATLTFPVPFHAVVTRLEAKVDDRRLVGETKAKAVARESYEDAIDRGKPAVLHEELLRGLHMLSLANVAPGKEVEVTATFVMPVTLSDGNGEFRIPTTVGHVYGEAPFVDSDAPVVGGPVLKARVAVVASKGIAHVNGKSASAAVTARLDRPVDVRVVGLYEEKPEPVFGRAADGRKVSISFSPETARDVALDADLLLDVSGSMKMDYDSDGEVGTKWDAVIAGFLSASEKSFRKDDKVTVWSFSGSCRKHGTMSGDEVGKFVKDMPFDSGGTELQAAVSTVTLSRPETNVLLLTDGKSWNKIDVQQAVSTGARFTVILVGESSLETSVGYLAAMTGGQMFVVGSAGVHSAIVAAVASMRNVSSPVVPVNGKPETVSRRIAGTIIEAKWSDESAEAPAEASLSSAAAFAADLAGLPPEKWSSLK